MEISTTLGAIGVLRGAKKVWLLAITQNDDSGIADTTTSPVSGQGSSGLTNASTLPKIMIWFQVLGFFQMSKGLGCH